MADDKRVALLAVMATIVVGVSGPLITLQATKSGETTAANNTRQLADVTELRQVLDQALADVQRFYSSTVHTNLTWYHLAGMLVKQPTKHFDVLEREYRALDARSEVWYEDWQRDLARLRIRLGTNHLSDLYLEAGNHFEGSRSIMMGTLQERAYPKKVAKDLSEALGEIGRGESTMLYFIGAASRFVGSHT